ncbi:MAG TPA: AIR synthase related protein, partial [bacterium]|nr:AIR synthase related protein [bacterium]
IGPLTDAAPLYDRPQKPADLKARQKISWDELKFSADWNETLLKMVASPNLCSRRWVWRQYDHMVMTNTLVQPGSDAAVLRIKGLKQGVAVTSDCNSRYCFLDPHLGAQHAVAEAARNLACSGAKPLATTDCLNFGNPEKPEIMWEFAEAVRGMGEACRALDAPIVSGNVSLYNDTNGVSIFPTPTIGMVGRLEDASQCLASGFREAGDLIFLLGDLVGSLGASEYLSWIHGKTAGAPPPLDLSREKAAQDFVLRAIGEGLLASAHDVSDGGLAVALAESCFTAADPDLGIDAVLEKAGEGMAIAELLFGEGASRILLSVKSGKAAILQELAAAAGLPLHRLGAVQKGRFRLGPWLDLPIARLREVWDKGFERILRRGE